MPRLLLPLTLRAAATATLSQSPATPTGPSPERHEFILHYFRTESGAILPEVHIVYG